MIPVYARALAAALAAVTAGGAAWFGGGPLVVAGAALAGAIGAGLVAGRDKGRAAGGGTRPAIEPGSPTGLDILREAPVALILLDRQGNVRFSNKASDDLLGAVPPGAALASVLRARALSDAVASVAASGGESTAAFTHMRAREQRELLAHVRRLPAGLPGEAAVMVAVEDRTGPASVDRMRRDFIANASHELKTPLASIAGFIETLQGPAKDDPAAAERFLPIMAKQAERMKRLIDDLMSLNRIEMSAHLRPAGRVALGPLLREAAAGLAPLADAAGARIEIDLPEDPGVITGERDQLSQLFVNLLDNAIKYGGSGAAVRIHRAAEDPGRSQMIGISVTDAGPGISREHIPRLTERFFRVARAGGKTAEGTGLGLSIVKHILNRHRGDLTIRSEPGAGATFTVWLPRAEATSPAANP